MQMHPIGSSRAALCGGHLEHGFPANAPAESRSLHWNALGCGGKQDWKTFHSSAPRRQALQSQAGGMRRQRRHSLRISDASPHRALTTPNAQGCTVRDGFAAAPLRASARPAQRRRLAAPPGGPCSARHRSAAAHTRRASEWAKERRRDACTARANSGTPRRCRLSPTFRLALLHLPRLHLLF